jgi:hypothetical protein
MIDARAYVFDAYGTLFNVLAAIGRHRAAAGPDADRFSEIWRSKQLDSGYAGEKVAAATSITVEIHWALCCVSIQNLRWWSQIAVRSDLLRRLS